MGRRGKQKNIGESKEHDQSVKKAKIGRQNGLRVVFDQHSNQKSFGTLSKDYNAMQLFVGGSTEFPLIRDRGFLIDPGQEHFIDISGISIKASPDIREMQASQRNCYFPSEYSLSYHTQYTYSACKFEEGLISTVHKINCTPWFLPSDPQRTWEMCDPWRAMEFMKEMGKEREDVGHCLPDCQITKYSIQRSSAALRSCHVSSKLGLAVASKCVKLPILKHLACFNICFQKL